MKEKGEAGRNGPGGDLAAPDAARFEGDFSPATDPRGAETRPEPEAGGTAGLLPRPTGAPERPLLEAGLLFAAFWLVAYLPADPTLAGASFGEAATQLAILVQILPKALFTLYFIARAEGLAAFGLRAFARADAPRAMAVALGALGIVMIPGLLSAAFGAELTNPLLDAAQAAERPSLLLLPLVVLASLAVGYGEELFFRVYLIRRLRQAGLARALAALASALVFGSAHGIQGVLGLALGTLLGAYFAWRWLRRGNFHEIALGHALYDIAVIVLSLYA